MSQRESSSTPVATTRPGRPPARVHAPIGIWLRQQIAHLVLVVLLLLSVDGALPQLQLWLFNGFVPVPSVVLKALLILLLAFAWIVNPRQKVPLRILAAWWPFTSYFVFVSLWLSYSADHSVIDVLTIASGYFFFALILPLAFALENTLPSRSVLLAVLAVAVPLCALGIYQFATNSPVLPTRSIDEGFAVNVWLFYGLTRGFSLFSSGAQFGHYLALSAALAASVLFSRGMRPGHRRLAGSILLLVLAATLATLTRGAYLEVMIVTGVAWALATRGPVKPAALKTMSVVAGILGLALVVAGSTVQTVQPIESDVGSGESSRIRIDRWVEYSEDRIGTDLKTMLFGSGVVQTRAINDQHLVIDNVPLAVVISIGAIGLILWLVLMWKVWAFVVAKYHASADLVLLGIAAALSVWLFRGMIRIAFAHFGMLPLLAIMVAGLPRRRPQRS